MPQSRAFATFVSLLLLLLLLPSSLPLAPLAQLAPTYPITSPQGTALRPSSKARVAVLGAGGCLGGTIYGMLQRSSSLFPYGISQTRGSPRAVCATSKGTAKLASTLATSFVLAFAGEDKLRLTDMGDPASLAARFEGFDVLVMGARYKRERCKVDAGTYGKTSNDMALEPLLELDGVAASPQVNLVLAPDAIEPDDGSLFRRAAAAAPPGAHLVVLGVAGDAAAAAEEVEFLSSLPNAWTFIYPCATSLSSSASWSFLQGIAPLSATNIPFPDPPGSSISFPPASAALSKSSLAAFATACVHSLDLSASRIVSVAPAAEGEVASVDGRKSSDIWTTGQAEAYSAIAGIN